MEIKDVLRKDLFIDDLKSKDKESVLFEMTKKLLDQGYIKDQQDFLDKIKAREEISSTGIGDGIGIPHAKSDDLNEKVVVYAKSKS